ncbi:MAG: DinB family protein [Phycisphaerae bacterium]|nr:DinB family protein [Phycisphaerae bacterium]
MSTIQRDHALRSLAFAHAITEKAIAGFPESKLTHQPSPTDNHLLWTIGHLTTTYAWFKSCFDGAMFPLPDSYNDLFGMGSKPKSDHAAYPGIVELKRHFESSYEAFIAAAKKLSDADLAQPPATETGGFCNDKLDALERAAWHEGWHCGQLCSVRKHLNLPGVF